MPQLGSNATAAGGASAISMQGVGGSNGLSQTNLFSNLHCSALTRVRQCLQNAGALRLDFLEADFWTAAFLLS